MDLDLNDILTRTKARAARDGSLSETEYRRRWSKARHLAVKALIELHRDEYEELIRQARVKVAAEADAR